MLDLLAVVRKLLRVHETEVVVACRTENGGDSGNTESGNTDSSNTDSGNTLPRLVRLCKQILSMKTVAKDVRLSLSISMSLLPTQVDLNIHLFSHLFSFSGVHACSTFFILT